MGMSDNYFYLNSNTILDKEKASWVEEFYTMGTTDKGKITFFVIRYSRKGDYADALAIFRNKTEAEQIDVSEFIDKDDYSYDDNCIRKYVIPQVTYDELSVLIAEPDSQKNDAKRLSKVTTISDARAYIKEEQELLKQLQAIMGKGWKECLLDEVNESLEQIENLQDAQAMLDNYTAQWYKYHVMVVPSFWNDWGEPYCDFLTETLLPVIREKITSLQQTQAINNAGAEGEKRTAYALKWLAAVGYREIVKDCSNKFGSNRLILQNTAFVDESQEYDHIIIGRNGIFCIETKNYSGELRIEPSGDWVHVNDDEEIGMLNPVFQCDRHHALLQSILGNQVPIVDVICIANDQAIIRGRENCPIAVIKYDQLSRYIQNYATPAALTDQEIESIISKINQHKRLN